MPPAAGTALYRKDIVVCPTPGVLSLVGVTSRDVVTTRHALDHDMFTKHGMTRKALSHLPSAIVNPICIAESQSVPGALEILTTLTETVEELDDPLFVFKDTANSYLFVLEMQATNNKGVKSNVAVAIQVKRSESGHYLLSAYPLDALDKIVSQSEQKHLVYSKYTDSELNALLNKQTTPPTDGASVFFQSALVRSAVKGGLTPMVKTKSDLVKYKSENNLSFSMERNLAAVHSLSPEKFLAALELGGMPMPSVAVTRLDRPYRWGGAGNIMLVGVPRWVRGRMPSSVACASVMVQLR